jgi:hypothetical protein
MKMMDQHLHCRCRIPQESLQEFLQEQELHGHQALSLNALPRLRQRPVMPAAGCLRVRLAFGHSQTQEPLALACAPFA